MASKSKVCSHCQNLQSALIEKENEIKKLKSIIQNLSNFLLWKDSSVQNPGLKDDIKNDVNEISKSDIKEQKFYSSDLFLISCDVLDKHIIMKSKSVQTEDNDNPSTTSVATEEDMEVLQSEVGNLNDYVYDKNYQMYYSLSTGYYYDEKSGLMYEPQNGTYYRYNYDKKEYETVSQGEETSSSCIHEDKTTSSYMCESMLAQVNNLNLNEVSTKTEQSEDEVKNMDTVVYESSMNENCDVVYTKESREENVSLGCAKDWKPTEGSKLTVTDMVRQVVEEHDNMSDYIYDEIHKMYYSPSTGYFYDAVRKLLYDPTTGIYYFYDADKQTYEFYCQTNPNASDEGKSTVKQDSINKEKLTYRKMYWKKKLEHSKQIQNTSKVDGDDEDNNSKDSDEEFSSLEDGEILSSDNDSDLNAIIIRSPVRGSCPKQKSTEEEAYPPSIRAIVENSENLQIGSLILITCSGGSVGRDKMNAIYIPDICVSKVHAKIHYNSDFQMYNIEDLGSQNGTFVNDKRLSEPKIKSEPCTLAHGDKLSFGTCKFLLHIHEGHETCDSCEPGQVLAEISSHIEKNAVLMSKEEKEKFRREELRRLKKKYGLQGADYERKAISVISQGYEDKAEFRRQTVGSDNPYEKTQEASIDTSMPETNKGYQMLKKMGWKEGQTLGTTDCGLVEPIPLRPWTSKAGLGSSGEPSSSCREDKRSKKWVKAQERYFKLSLGEGDAS